MNKHGKGINNGKLEDVLSLKKRKDSSLVTRRDDGTVIIEEKKKKWIKFPCGTEYLEEDGLLTIEK